MKSVIGMTLAATTVTAALASAAAAQDGWRTVAPENLLVLDTSKGRVLAELAPEAAPQHVERVRTLAGQGFYDGLRFHRVIRNFMAQTGDPLGTGAGGSDLPDVPGEFSFRRGSSSGFAAVPQQPGRPLEGLVGTLPVTTQPDAQMMVTADFRVPATAQFCPGVVGAARTGDPNSANSQFFLMTGANSNLNGEYTALGRVLVGLDVARALQIGDEASDGAVGDDADTIVTARIAADMPEGERPTVRVADHATLIQRAAEARSACDVAVPAEVVGG